MKKIYFSLFALISGFAINAQTLTQVNNAPVIGDVYSTMACDSTINQGPAGAGVVWNFSNLLIRTNVVSNFSTSAVVAAGYPANGQVTGSSINDLIYTNSDATALRYFGGNFKITPIEASFTYSAPAIFAAYPMSLNTASTSVVGGSLNLTQPTSQAGSFTGNSAVVADGTGTLILPGVTGTFTNVLRTLSTQTLNYTAGFLSGVVTIKRYNYFAPGIKPAILSLTTNTIVAFGAPSSGSFASVYKDYLNPVTNTATAIGEINTQPIDIVVYPNPSASMMNFFTENQNAKEILIYDITGKLVERQIFNIGKAKVDVNNYSNGLYVYSILNNKGATLKTGKVSVVH
jgi:hypothetical protein